MNVKSRFTRITALFISMMIFMTSAMPVFADETVRHMNPTSKEKRYIIGLKKDIEKSNFIDSKKLNQRHKKSLKYENAVVMELDTAELQSLMNDAAISYIEADSEAQILSNDKPTKREVKQDQQEIPWGNHAIGVDLIKKNLGNKIKIAVLDTGVSQHPDLKIKEAVSFVEYTTNANDDNGHGTHVVGIVNAQDNKNGIVGVSPNADLYVGKVLNANGSGHYSDIIAGIEWAIDMNVDLINMSFGGHENSQALQTVIQKAKEKGIIIVAAAGNEGTGTETALFPARYDEVVSVGAVNENHNRAPFSSTSNTLDLMAPGTNIVSTLSDGGYGTMSGTSMAAPYVTGALALLLSDQKHTSSVAIVAKATETATIIGDSHECGYGLINIAKALGITDNIIKPGNGSVDPPASGVTQIKKIENAESFNIDKVAQEVNRYNSKLVLFEKMAIEKNDIQLAKSILSLRYSLSAQYNALTNLPENLSVLDKGLTSRADQQVAVKNFYAAKAIEIREFQDQYYREIVKYSKVLGLGNEHVVEKLDSWEPNNDFQYARNIPVGLSLNAIIENSDDIDYYSYTANETGSAFVHLYMPSDLNYNLWVLDQNRNTLGFLTLPAGQTETFTFNVVSGQKYYFVVFGASGSDYSSERTYNLLTSHITPTITFEALNLNSPLDVSLEAGASKVYSFTPSRTDSYRIETLGFGGSNVSNDTFLEVFSDASLTNRLYFDDDSNGNSFSRVENFLTGGTTYFVKLRHFDTTSGKVSARIQATISPPPMPILSTNSPIDVDIPAGLQNVYKITPTTSGLYTITTTPYAGTGSNNDTFLELYSDASLTNRIAYDDDSNGNTFSKLKHFLNSGNIYYLKLRHYNTTTAVHCRLNMTFESVNTTVPIYKDSPVDLTVNQNESRVFSFTPQTTNTYNIETSLYGGNGPATDTFLELFTDSALTNRIGFDDDSGDVNFSRIEKELVAGQTYFIKCFGYNNNAASARLTVTLANPDIDGDGLSNEIEKSGIRIGYKGTYIGTVWTNPNLKDSDGDGIDDGIEVYKLAYSGYDEDKLITYYEMIDNPMSAAQATHVLSGGINQNYEGKFNFNAATIDELKQNIIDAGICRQYFEVYANDIEARIGIFNADELNQVDDYLVKVTQVMSTFENISDEDVITLLADYGTDPSVTQWVLTNSSYVAFREGVVTAGIDDVDVLSDPIRINWMQFGTRVHTAVQAKFRQDLGSDTGNSNARIPGSLSRPDLVYDKLGNMFADIYELKPITYKVGYLNTRANKQLEKYIALYLKGYGKSAKKGTTWPPFNTVIVPVPASGDRVVIVQAFPDQPGLLFYQEVKRKTFETQYSASQSKIYDVAGNEYVVLATYNNEGLVLISCGGVLAIVGVQAGLAAPASVTLLKLIELVQRGIPLPVLQ